jgi:chromosome segregation ATPase
MFSEDIEKLQKDIKRLNNICYKLSCDIEIINKLKIDVNKYDMIKKHDIDINHIKSKIEFNQNNMNEQMRNIECLISHNNRENHNDKKNKFENVQNNINTISDNLFELCKRLKKLERDNNIKHNLKTSIIILSGLTSIYFIYKIFIGII